MDIALVHDCPVVTEPLLFSTSGYLQAAKVRSRTLILLVLLCPPHGAFSLHVPFPQAGWFVLPGEPARRILV